MSLLSTHFSFLFHEGKKCCNRVKIITTNISTYKTTPYIRLELFNFNQRRSNNFRKKESTGGRRFAINIRILITYFFFIFKIFYRLRCSFFFVISKRIFSMRMFISELDERLIIILHTLQMKYSFVSYYTLCCFSFRFSSYCDIVRAIQANVRTKRQIKIGVGQV